MADKNKKPLDHTSNEVNARSSLADVHGGDGQVQRETALSRSSEQIHSPKMPQSGVDVKQEQNDEDRDMEFEHLLQGYAQSAKSRVDISLELLQRIQKIPDQKASQSIKSFSFLGPLEWIYRWWAPLAATGVLLVLFTMPWEVTNRVSSRHSHLIPKGLSIHIELQYARKNKEQKLLRYVAREAETLYSGDLLQFVYQFKKPRKPKDPPVYLMIIGLNERGESIILAPFEGDRSTLLSKAKNTFPQGESLEITNEQLGKERFFALLSTKPFASQQAKEALANAWKQAEKQLDDISELPGPWHLAWSIRIHKVQEPKR